MEKELWEEVGAELVQGTVPSPSDANFKETFVLGKLDRSEDVLQ